MKQIILDKIRKTVQTIKKLVRGEEEKRRITNNKYTENRVFKKACELAELPPTTRQASKYRRGRGLAARYAKRALSLSNQEVIKETFSG